MAGWIITVAGIALLSVLIEVILPDGNTKKYVSTVIGVVISFVMVTPIITVLQGFSTKNLQFEEQLSIQQSYLEGVSQQKYQWELSVLQDYLVALGVEYFKIEQTEAQITLHITCAEEQLQSVKRYVEGLDCQVYLLYTHSK